MNSNDIDLIVEAVTRKVKERLADGQFAMSNTCDASASDCDACGNCVVRRPDDVQKIVDLGAVRLGIRGTTSEGVARFIDHTLLKPDATKEELLTLCNEAKQHQFFSVCVNSSNVEFCKRALSGTTVKVVAVVGFPLGAASSGTKAYEAREAINAGAEEIDMVLNIGAMKSRNYALALDDIAKVVEASRNRKVKVIIETSNLTNTEKIIACALSKAAGAHFVKTSTGFGGGGATAEDVALMKEVVGADMEVKASGGIRSYQDVSNMLEAGATRVGASASVAIVQGKTAKTAY